MEALKDLEDPVGVLRVERAGIGEDLLGPLAVAGVTAGLTLAIVAIGALVLDVDLT